MGYVLMDIINLLILLNYNKCEISTLLIFEKLI